MTKIALFSLGASVLLVPALMLGGCGKSSPPVRTVEATPTPRPKPTPDSLFDTKDFDTDKLRRKAGKAADAVGQYLDTQDPKMRARFQQLTNRISEQISKDKGHWREKLEARKNELGPEIDRLKAQLAQGGGAAKDKLRRQLDELEKQNTTTDQKLSKLESIGTDAWKRFKAQLKQDETQEKAASVNDAKPGSSPSDE